MTILSFNSRVVSGRVGHAVAQPVLEWFGQTVWPLDTVVLSNHPGHGLFRGSARPAADLTALLDGLDELGRLSACDAIFSGYLGRTETAAVVADAVRRVKAVRPDALYICDPVMGDQAEGLYVDATVAAAIADDLVPLADIILPNVFELARLTGGDVRDIEVDVAMAEMAARQLSIDIGVAVLVTGLIDGDECHNVLVDGPRTWTSSMPMVTSNVKGTGDLFAAVLAARCLDGAARHEAMADAGAAVHSVLRETVARDSDELMILEAMRGLPESFGSTGARPKDPL